eukprot:2630804-Rhodomonas_salina.12
MSASRVDMSATKTQDATRVSHGDQTCLCAQHKCHRCKRECQRWQLEKKACEHGGRLQTWTPCSGWMVDRPSAFKTTVNTSRSPCDASRCTRHQTGKL